MQRFGKSPLFLLLCLCGVLHSAKAQSADVSGSRTTQLCAATGPGAATISVPRAGANFLGLCDGHALRGAALGEQGRPLALASGDFDGDGVPDLVAGLNDGNRGTLRIYRGNVQALWPYGVSVKDGMPQAFLSRPGEVSLPEAPDFVVTGDFNADGRLDIVTAQRGSNTLYFLGGDGHGSFAAPQRIRVGGSVTAMISGEINRPDGLTDLIIGVKTDQGARVLIYESARGAIRAQPEVISVPQPVTALALGRFDDGGFHDLAIASGTELVVIHGRDRRLSEDSARRDAVAPPHVTVQSMAFHITGMAGGDFTGTGPSLAIVGDDGKLHILDHELTHSLLAKAAADPNFVPSFRPAGHGHAESGPAVAGRISPDMSARLATVREALELKPSAAEWTERSALDLPSGFSLASAGIVAAHITGSLREDIVLADRGNSALHLFSTMPEEPRPIAHFVDRTAHPVSAVMRKLTSMSSNSAPTALLPMRLSKHGLKGLVVLQSGSAEPVLMPQDTPGVFTVTNTQDTVTIGGDVPAGSLRAAMNAANSSGGPASIVFNIPTSDPGYNAATGVFLIQPLSEAPPDANNVFALPPINATMTIDGYTQPGASPNTLTAGGNARINIQIDGSLATTPGGDGLEPFDDTGSVFRGISFTNWANPQIIGDTASGASGIEMNGAGDFAEGNFSGVLPDGKTADANRIGIFDDNGPEEEPDSGNVIGGTTPQARNILSGNVVGGVLLLSIAFESSVQGNFVGLDSTGALEVPNSDDGVGLNGPTVTVGGVLPNTGNVISGNDLNVDINDITEGGAAQNSYVFGNLVGTNPAGTAALTGRDTFTGVGIASGPSYMTIGGPSPAARNVISGNDIGLLLSNNVLNNTIQGNYIGTDVSGTKAIGNSMQGLASYPCDTSDCETSGISTPPGGNIIGGVTAGAGNVISGNASEGVLIDGEALSGEGGSLGSSIQGNFIGTDATGTKSLPNISSGVHLVDGTAGNLIGGANPGAANLIANNMGDGVLIDTAESGADGTGNSNQTIANVIATNGGAGVKVLSGTQELISKNSIFANGALGIALGTAGGNINTNCNVTNTGPNDSQNAPVLTAGTGSDFITATATDPSGNTSQFSNAVAASSSGNMLDLLGTFNSTPNTTYTIEFFSSPSADASGYGQGETYLGSTTITTGSDCNAPINNPINTTGADLSVKLANAESEIDIGPDFGLNILTATVANNGPAVATNVTFTNTLPSGLIYSNMYCNFASCQTPVVTTLGTCTVNGQVLTCNLGTLNPGATAMINIPVQATAPGSLTDSATVSATQTDPNTANNTATLTRNVYYPEPFIDHLDPVSALAGSPAIQLTVYGNGLVANTTVNFNGTNLPTALFDNQTCSSGFSSEFCTGLQVTVPASLLKTAGTPTVTVTNPDPGPEGFPNTAATATFTIAPACSYILESTIPVPPDTEPNDGTSLIPEQIEVDPNVASCSYTAVSSVPWAVILDNASGTGYQALDVAFAPNTDMSSRSGSITIAGQNIPFTQDGGATCSYAFSPASATAAATGGGGTIPITSGSSCSYFVSSYADWITIPQNSALLTGNGTASYTVAPNTGPPRTGSILIGGNVFTVNQNAASCFYTINPTAANVSENGASGTIAVTPSASSCTWTATPSDSAAITISSGSTGTGNGTVDYTVAPNNGGPRTPTITIGSSTSYATFTANQASDYVCSFTVTPASFPVSANGRSDQFLLTASQQFCNWTAVSNDPTVVSISPSSGTGSASILFRVAQNSTDATRTLTVTAGCQTFTIIQAGEGATNPVPTISSINPSSVAAGSGAFTLTINGTNFLSSSTVNVNGTAVATTYKSATQLTAAIPAADVATAGSDAITVTNPSPGGGTSNSVPLTVTGSQNPVPMITSINPASVQAGSGAFTLTVNGTNFISGSTVSVNGTAVATTYKSATQLTAAIPAADVATAGSDAITVKNPSPGGGTSNSVTLTVTGSQNPVPTIASISPNSVAAGSATFTLTVTGTNFIAGSTVNVNGAAAATTFVSASQVTAAIPASAVATAGSDSITVTNPSPGGGTSNTVTLTVTASNNPSPTITSISPSTQTAGAASFTLTVNGTNFVSGATVNFNGSVEMTTFVSGTKLTATIPAAAVATAGTYSVTVTNPAPGGGTSNSVTFTVDNPMPTITSLQPATATTGSALTLIVNGAGFNTSSIVAFNGNAEMTTYVSTTQLKAAISGADTANAGTVPVTVTNPAPGGGTSSAATFTITVAMVPVVSLNPVTLSFGGTVVGSKAAAQTVTLSNTGNAVLSISAISFTGASASSFTETDICGTSVAAGSSCTVSVVFAPTAAGSLSASLSVADNATGSPQTVSLSGTGTLAPSFVLSSSPTVQTIQSGGMATYTITVTSQNGTYPGTVGLTATGLPANAIATFTPTQLTPGSGSSTSQLTIQLSSALTSSRNTRTRWPMAVLALPLFSFFFGIRKRHGTVKMLPILLLMSLFALGSITGCGGGFGAFGSPAQTYAVTVTGTSGADQQSTNLQLIVK